MGKGHWYAIRVTGFNAHGVRVKCPEVAGQPPQLTTEGICYGQEHIKRSTYDRCTITTRDRITI